MKLLPLLAVVIVLTTQAFACNYDRISRDPNYAEISKPKSTLRINGVHGICVAPNGDIAVVSYNKGSNVRIYYSCGKMMKAVDLTKNGYHHGSDCTFMNNYLYVTDFKGRKVFKLSITGKLVKVFHGQFMRVTSCKNELYFTKGSGGKNVVVYNGNGKELRSFSVPGSSRGIIVGIDGHLYVSNWQRKQVYKYTKQGKQVGVTNYKDIRHADGLAMDSAGHLLIADYTGGGKVVVYSPCGDLIKTIQVPKNIAVPDVEIGNDGTVIVAAGNKVLLF